MSVIMYCGKLSAPAAPATSTNLSLVYVTTTCAEFCLFANRNSTLLPGFLFESCIDQFFAAITLTNFL